MTAPPYPAIRSTLRDEAASLRARLARAEADLATLDSSDARHDEIYEVGCRARTIAAQRMTDQRYNTAASAAYDSVRSEVIDIEIAPAGGER